MLGEVGKGILDVLEVEGNLLFLLLLFGRLLRVGRLARLFLLSQLLVQRSETPPCCF